MILATDENLDLHLAQHNILLVDFWAEWCRPCKMFSPILDEISKEFPIWIAKIDIDLNPIQTEKYNVTSVPTTILFENGKEVKRIIGARPKHTVIEEIKQWL